MSENHIACPLCGEPVKHEIINGTHAWICVPCPLVGFEFWKDEDAQNMLARLTK